MNTVDLQQAFAEVFGKEADATFFSPGRINLIGEHTDSMADMSFLLRLP